LTKTLTKMTEIDADLANTPPPEGPCKAGSRTASCSAGEYLLAVFRALRFSKAHHKGLGDIQLSMGKQEEIAALVDEFLKQNAEALSSERSGD